jgi:beta-lactamase class A
MHSHVSRRGLLIGGTTTALLVASASRATAAPAGSPVGARLRELEQAYQGRIGAWALDTGSGTRVGYRAGERFPLLSTFKALAGAAILRTARRRDPGLLDRLIRYTADDLLPGSDVTAAHLGTGMTVEALCAAAIEFSDNTAGNLLLAQLGGPVAITRFARSLGDPVTRLDRIERELNIWNPAERRDTTTPAAIGRDLAALTVGRALVPADREKLIGWLRASVTGGARIRAGLPATWTVGDKTGSGPTYGAANDIAIACPPGAAALVLAVYTNRDQADASADNAVIASTATILAQALGKL